ncbi:hypothetical protein GKO46_13090 [SAR202 cluster bacterium JH702]|uniref:Uncharacterized protein n=1 Tax=Candidatus Lucifugimonas marina TaxID=3038979 RepID=A0ABD4XU51_9CHLR|nr:hypothetical protein [SAR202 cluster bacterium JH702]
MNFFWLWIQTRLKENGWPKSKGFINKRTVVTDTAIVAAAQDAIRVAITIGASHPDIARSIAIEYIGEAVQATRDRVDQWLHEANDKGESKMSDLAEVEPGWLRFCSIEASKGDMVKIFPWSGGDDEYDMSGNASDLILQSLAVAGIAMGWGMSHSSDAVQIFDPSKSPHFERTDYSDFPSAEDTYASWLRMAEELITRYKGVGGFRDYDELPAN